jgi:dolichol-phosphate mannosyltransferase
VASTSSNQRPLDVSLVIPVYQESRVVADFHALLRAAIDGLPERFTIYYINDGSTDDTERYLTKIAAADPRVQVIGLVRNFGHQAALSAGLDLAAGDVVISLDGDGQHPPELIPQLLALYRTGYDIVQTQRLDRPDQSLFGRSFSAGFYWFINKMAGEEIRPGGADFRLMSRDAVDGLRQMPEYHRFLRGMIPWMGYSTVVLPYHAPGRIGGKTKYSLKKRVKLAEDAIFSFSLVPMRLATVLGLLFFVMAGVEVAYVLSFWVTGRQEQLAPGWSSLMFMLLITTALLLINLGTIGLYIGYIFQEVKRRPVYLIKRRGPKREPEEPPAETSV